MDGKPMWVEELSLACSLWRSGIKQKSHSKLKCMHRARLLQHQGLRSLCGLLMFPGHIPRPQIPPPETFLGLALFPEKMQGRLGKATALSPCFLLTPWWWCPPAWSYRRLSLKCILPGPSSSNSHIESLGLRKLHFYCDIHIPVKPLAQSN